MATNLAAALRRPLSAAARRKLSEAALRGRRTILRLSGDGGCFIGAALSCVDLLIHLYTRVLRLDPADPKNPDRDRFFLSKGHAVPALYAALIETGFVKAESLAEYLKPGSPFYWHPNPNVPGIEFHSGSLGHGLLLAVGAALDARLRRSPARIFVLTGDGELDEGSNWEALLIAAAYHLDNLVLIVDRNGFQANGPTEEILPLEPLPDKLKAFGARTAVVDGHQFDQLEKVFARMPLAAGRPSAVIARTVRGRGLPSIEARADRWFADFPAAERESLLRELELPRAARGGGSRRRP